MLLLDLANCGPSGILKVVYFFKLILDVLFIIIPIALIILLTIDFSKAMISGDENAQKKSVMLGAKRILYAVIVFCVPYIVSIFNLILGDLGVDYSACYTDITLDAIKQLEAEEIAVEKAKEVARKALIEKQREEAKKKEEQDKLLNSSSSSSLPNASGCDGYVYYENGVFYKFSNSVGKKYNGTVASQGSAPYAYNKYFYSMLVAMKKDANKAGHTFNFSQNKGDGAWRSLAKQEEYWKTKGSTWAASPGTSRHGWGIASDVNFGGKTSSQKWAHANASKYGLSFPLSNEAWHIEPVSQKVDDSKVKKCIQ